MRNKEKRYKQIVHLIEEKITSGEYHVGDKIPSVNAYKIRFGLSRSSIFQAMNELKNAEQSKKFKHDTEVAAAEKAKAELEGSKFVIKAKAGESGKLFGSITAKEIAAEIKRQKSLDIDKRRIVLKSDIKTVGDSEVEIKLYTGISANITVSIEKI